MMSTRNQNRRMNDPMGWIALLAALLVLASSPVLAGQKMQFNNGISATFHSSDEIARDFLSKRDGDLWLEHPGAAPIELHDNVETSYPFDYQQVLDALASMHGFETKVDVEVFILPATPVTAGGSFASRGAIYLAPGFGKVDPSTIAYIVTHEMGHVMTWAFLDDHPQRWNAYCKIRGLNESTYSSDARHADRPREILAEDIRFLFGGGLANVSRSIENHELVTPDQVDGLEELLVGFFENRDSKTAVVFSQAFPNPCNPMTMIEMAVPDSYFAEAGRTVLDIYDIRGARIQQMRGAEIFNGRLSIRWNGTASTGGTAPSGRYFYVMQVGDLISKGSVTLVR